MQRTSVERITIVQEIVCDRCGVRAFGPGKDDYFMLMTSIGFRAGKGSIFGQGRRVEIDLCERGLRSALGAWLKVRAPAGGEIGADLAHGQSAFNAVARVATRLGRCGLHHRPELQLDRSRT